MREGIERALEDEKDAARRDHLIGAARGLYRARIETIHSFATALLRERPVEAGLDPEFHALTGLESDLRFDDQFDDWLADLLSEPREEVEAALNLGLGPDQLKQAARLIHAHRYLLPLAPIEAGSADASEIGEWISQHRKELEGIAARCNNEENPQPAQIAEVLGFAERIKTEGTSAGSLARLVAHEMPVVSLQRGSQSDWNDPSDCRRWKKELGPEYRELRELVPMQMRAAALTQLVPLLEEFVREYENARRAEGLAGFDDLIIWARDLIRDRPEVREYFRNRFRVLAIDEFQDTDPIQVELAMLLASDDNSGEWRKLKPVPGKLFLVGDPKQSIYRFRRADIGIYDEVKTGPLAAGLREIVQNFRSVPRVIEWVNRTFDRLFEQRPGLQPANVPLEATPFEEGLDRPPVVVLRGHDPEANADALRRNEAEAMAAVIKAAIEGPDQWPVRDPSTDELRAPTWRDVAILLPTRAGLEAFEEALAAVGVPYRHEGSRDYFQRDEVRELIFVLRSIDDPRDRLSLIGALRSGAFGCSDDDLVIHAATGGRWDYRFEQASESERVLEAFGVLKGLHYARERLSLPLLVQRAVAESRLVEVALTGRDGPQGAANLLAIVEQARAFTAAGGGSPRAFTRWLAENTEREASEVDAGIAEETDDVVRIMTMHGAKGLEFPIVALANLAGRGANHSGPVPDEAGSRLHFGVGPKNSAFETPGYEDCWDEERAALDLEDIRLLYVAATRARDHLLIGDVRGKQSAGPLLVALEPLLPEHNPLLDHLRARLGENPGHEEEIDGVWMLDAAKVERPAPVEVERRKVKAPEAKASLVERDAWAATQSELIKAAREGLELEVASSVKRSVRPLAAEASHSDAAMLVSEGPPLEIGDALHKVMEKVSLPAGDDLQRWAEAVCAEFGIAEHADEVIELAHRCLDSPTVRGAIAAGSVLREVPISTATDSGFTIGRADLVFRDGDELVAVDYKTDLVSAERAEAHTAERHSAQASAYLASLQTATGEPVSHMDFVYCRPGIEVRLFPTGRLHPG